MASPHIPAKTCTIVKGSVCSASYRDKTKQQRERERERERKKEIEIKRQEDRWGSIEKGAER